MGKPVAYLVGFAAPPVLELHKLVNLMNGRGWDCHVILSPTAASWFNLDQLELASGHVVQVSSRKPGQPSALPPADLIIAAPLTFNSLNKWAQGHNDTLALGILNEATGQDAPKVAVVWAKVELQRHPAYASSVEILKGAAVVIEPISWSSHPTSMDWKQIADFSCRAACEKFERDDSPQI